ncbi:thiamine-phosphate pyrophosphorylase [Chitinivorax tropicus]|uniref:Thiamine-phosphate synthase n=2 Tax=Chitinivorax tropicus TaxID=714531 RepID=A0A840MQM4_9PROT|nr:thiamine-phosphate pyrophosphorylase [Chitinivorax tropicus]
MKHEIRGVYAITPDTMDTETLINKSRLVLTGGVSVLQYRNKHRDQALRLEQASSLKALCDEFSIPLIINDDISLAAEVGAAGVHLGKDDRALANARSELGSTAVVGISCYNQLSLARKAADEGASYVAFGAVFSSSTKPDAVNAPLSLFQQAKIIPVPVVAIGGITSVNALQVIQAGADAIAMISALFDAIDPLANSHQLSDLFR